MKFGVNTFIWSDRFDQRVESLLPAIREGGFDGVEVPLFRPGDFPAARIRKATEAAGLECNVCSVLTSGLSLIADDAAVRRKTRTHLADAIAAAAEAGVRIVAGPLYSPVGYFSGKRRTADEWSRAVEAYQELGPTLALHGVTLAIEPLNRFETYFLNTAADARALCDEVGHSSIGILFDTFHANIEEKDIAAGYRRVGPRLKHVHTCENDRGIPGTGHVNWKSVFDALREVNYDGWLTIESFGFALGELSAAASIWRDIEKTPDAIAFEGVRFLRQQCGA